MNSFSKLVRIMRRLRSADGCPWDRKQTHASLLKYLIEESKEVASAVRKRDYANLEEELGDVLLQVIFHARIAEEHGRFNIENVIATLSRKLKLRHPHVFGYTAAHRKLLAGRNLKTSGDVIDSWALLKQISVRRPKKR